MTTRPKEKLHALYHEALLLMQKRRYTEGFDVAHKMLKCFESIEQPTILPDVMVHYDFEEKDLVTQTVCLNYLNRVLDVSDQLKLEGVVGQIEWYKSKLYQQLYKYEEAYLSLKKAHELTQARLDRMQTLIKDVSTSLDTSKTDFAVKETLLDASHMELDMALELLQQTQDKLIQSEKHHAYNRMMIKLTDTVNTPVSSALSAIHYIRMELNDFKRSITEGAIEQKPITEVVGTIESSTNMVQISLDRIQAFIMLLNETILLPKAFEDEVIWLKEHIETLIHTHFRPGTFQIDWELDEQIRMKVTTILFDRVMLEVLRNVKQHSGQTEPITVNIGAHLVHDRVYLFIADDGRGMDDEVLDRVFQPFMTSNIRLYKGLGLFMAKRIVDDFLGGELEISSEKEEGTNIIMSFPHIY